MYIDKFDNIFNKRNNTYDRKTKMKSFDIGSGLYNDFGKALHLGLITI